MNHEQSLYQHVKRPEWGYSTVVDTQDDRTTFLFDDGTQRTIKVEHVHLMERVVLQEDAAKEVHDRLAKLGRGKGRSSARRSRSSKKAKPATTPS